MSKQHRPIEIRSRLRTTLLTSAWLPLLGFALLVAIRGIKVDGMVGAYTSCHRCILGGLIHHDLAIFGLLAALLALDLLSPWRVLRWLLRIIAALVVLVYALDFAVFAALTQRLYLSGLMTFGKEGGALGGFLKALVHRADIGAWFVVAIEAVLVMVASVYPRRRNRRAGCTLLVVAVIAVALWAMPMFAARYVHPEIVDNVFEANLGNSANAGYSDTFRASLGKRQLSGQKDCSRNAASDHPDVILVAVESMSAYHSALLGGPMDALPKLDDLARSNHYFTRFVANGFNTSGGRTALYTGRAPLPPPGWANSLPLAAYSYTRNTLVSYAHAAGYTAHYFTSGDLGFVNSTPWLEALGFDSIEGAESPFYKGMKRWQFNAPEDKALFDRVLSWVDHRKDSRPFVTTLLTVTSHPPFVNPRTGEIDQLGTFRYVDQQLARFYLKLRERGFFEHGVLMITGDHRSMTPLHPHEYQAWGERAFSRVPMIVIGDVDMPAVVRQSFAQTDVPTSFAWLAGARTCVDPARGNFARQKPEPPQYILHASGDQRNRVDVFFGKHRGSIILDGDDSRWQGPKPEDWRDILARVNQQRILEAESARNIQGTE